MCQPNIWKPFQFFLTLLIAEVSCEMLKKATNGSVWKNTYV